MGASAYGILNDTRTMLKEMVSNMQEKLKKKIGSSEENMMMMMNNRRAKMMKDGGGDETMVRIKNLEENIKELVTTVERIGRSIASPPDVELRIRTTREMLQTECALFCDGVNLGVFPWVLLPLLSLLLQNEDGEDDESSWEELSDAKTKF